MSFFYNIYSESSTNSNIGLKTIRNVKNNCIIQFFRMYKINRKKLSRILPATRTLSLMGKKVLSFSCMVPSNQTLWSFRQPIQLDRREPTSVFQATNTFFFHHLEKCVLEFSVQMCSLARMQKGPFFEAQGVYLSRSNKLLLLTSKMKRSSS